MFFKDEINPDFARKLFKSDEKTLRFISEIKWAEGFTCKKCGNKNFCEGKIPYSRRCTRCKTEESATAHTLFHNCKFPVSKAFYIAYSVCVEGKDISSYQYADKLDLRQMTCWKFRKKITECLARKSKKANPDKVAIHTILMNEE
jgi:two-component system, sensor histidine kinase LadS